MFDTKEQMINNNLKQTMGGGGESKNLKLAVSLILAPFAVNQYGNTL